MIHLASSGGQQSTSDFVLYLAMPLGMGAIAGAVVLWTDNTWWAAGTHGGFHVLLTLLSTLFPIALDSSTWVVLVAPKYLQPSLLRLPGGSERGSRKAGHPGYGTWVAC